MDLLCVPTRVCRLPQEIWARPPISRRNHTRTTLAPPPPSACKVDGRITNIYSLHLSPPLQPVLSLFPSQSSDLLLFRFDPLSPLNRDPAVSLPSVRTQDRTSSPSFCYPSSTKEKEGREKALKMANTTSKMSTMNHVCMISLFLANGMERKLTFSSFPGYPHPSDDPCYEQDDDEHDQPNQRTSSLRPLPSSPLLPTCYRSPSAGPRCTAPADPIESEPFFPFHAYFFSCRSRRRSHRCCFLHLRFRSCFLRP